MLKYTILIVLNPNLVIGGIIESKRDGTTNTSRAKLVRKLRVAMLAPPWLKIPPDGYGGIEEVLDGLLLELNKLGVSIDLFTIGETKSSRKYRKHSYYATGQYQHIHRPLYEVLPIAITQVQVALKAIQQDGGYDIIHDHNGYVGPLALYWATQLTGMPPALHTLHGPPFSRINIPERTETVSLWRSLAGAKRLYLVGISNALMKNAPAALRPQMVPTVYNAVNTDKFIYKKRKQKHFITLARFSEEKGQHVAAQICAKLGLELQMAGTVAGIASPQQLALEIANPLSPYRNVPDFKYYSDKVLPITVQDNGVRFIGNVSGERKKQFLANARALLFPIDWDEPFGMAVIEAMASGTPVVAMKRGAMAEIIDHGVNGFLANNPKEFKQYMLRIDEINPEDCLRTVKERFSAEHMAAEYLDRYRQIIELDQKARRK